ncbi:MAG: serine protease, partial [Thermoflexia bacterium]
MSDWERAVVRVDGEQTGTGFVVDRECGLLLTCAHVVGGRTEVRVRLVNGAADLPAHVLENWSSDLDAALLQVLAPLPEETPEPLLGLEVVPGHRFRSWGYHYAGEEHPLTIEGNIRGSGHIDGQPAVFLSSVEVAEGMSGAPLVDLET